MDNINKKKYIKEMQDKLMEELSHLALMLESGTKDEVSEARAYVRLSRVQLQILMAA
jgi:hypothetical protein|tara:strand:- start:1679 stop:1849 length:171 start_codon:yes stop_codon:yes gene_type:complete